MGLQQLKAEAIKLSLQERLELITAIVESLQNSLPQSDCDPRRLRSPSEQRRFGSSHVLEHRSAAIERMRGLLATDRPAPTDAEVTAMLEERLMKKYSS